MPRRLLPALCSIALLIAAAVALPGGGGSPRPGPARAVVVAPAAEVVPAAPPPCDVAAVPVVDLDPGLYASGDPIAAAQAALGLAADGVYGPATAAAVASWALPAGCPTPETARPVLEALTALSEASPDLAAQALARRSAPRAAGPPSAAAPAVQVAPSPDCYGVNAYAAWIYMRESGCNPANPNNPNCEGIGQSCPRGKMPCTWEDVACQLAYFEDYAIRRYGSWEGAYAFWLGNGWW